MLKYSKWFIVERQASSQELNRRCSHLYWKSKEEELRDTCHWLPPCASSARPRRVLTVRPLLSPPLVSARWLRRLMQRFLLLLPIDVPCLHLYSLVCLLVGEWPYFPRFYKCPDTEAGPCNTSSLKLLSWPWRGGLSRRFLPSVAGPTHSALYSSRIPCTEYNRIGFSWIRSK